MLVDTTAERTKLVMSSIVVANTFLAPACGFFGRGLVADHQRDSLGADAHSERDDGWSHFQLVQVHYSFLLVFGQTLSSHGSPCSSWTPT